MLDIKLMMSKIGKACNGAAIGLKKALFLSLGACFTFFRWMAGLAIRKETVIFVISQVVIFGLAFLLFGLWPIKNEVQKIQNQTDSLTVSEPAPPKDLVEKYRSAKSNEGFMKSKLNLAKSDSISLSIDFEDSVVQLAVKGVVLLETKIARFKVNSGFAALPDWYKNSIFSKPLKVKSDYSTIEKFPIVVKKAPKDTVEAQQSETAPTAPNQSDVFFGFEFDNNLVIEFHQQETDFIAEKRLVRNYFFELRKKSLMSDLKKLKSKHPGSYTYQIIIEIPREDARSIYRGLPVYPFVIVKL